MTVCNRKEMSALGAGLHAYLTICSETCLFWNLAGRSRMGFTVKHWMSACRKVKEPKDDSNWREFRWHNLQTVRIQKKTVRRNLHTPQYLCYIFLVSEQMEFINVKDRIAIKWHCNIPKKVVFKSHLFNQWRNKRNN